MGKVISDKQGRPIDIDYRGGRYKITPRERDIIYQKFLRAFPQVGERCELLREYRSNDKVRRRIREWIDAQAGRYPISATRIANFLSQAMATEMGVLEKRDRWDWWVGCSLK